MTPDFLFSLQPGDIGYDCETYPNVFTFRCRHITTGQRYNFEISFRRNDLWLLCAFIEQCNCTPGVRWVGFNNIHFDYPVVHWIYMNRNAMITVTDIYNKAMSIINAPFNARFAHTVWENDWLVDQLDLLKIHHFDNKAKATSLKLLEFNMRMDSIEDLPFDVGLNLNNEQADVLCEYNDHDIDATIKFYHHTKAMIDFREELTKKYDKNFINHNDTKIGKDYFIMELEKAAPGCCYQYVDGKRKMVQTIRETINLGDVILPYISFKDPEFNRILSWFKSQVITETKGVFTDASCIVNGFKFDFGTGGIHGSIESTVVTTDDEYTILDLDVASYYPNLAIANSFFPEHLGTTFCRIYREVYEMRKAHPKKEFPAINAMLKLALNGVYGDSNNKYSPFYDPQYTMSITINGQLLLCMLAEALMQSPDVAMVQINTDGLTVRCPRTMKPWVESVQRWWEQLTGLELEQAEYSRMMIRDVNNYIAEKVDGELKNKGAYVWKDRISAGDKWNPDTCRDWHQNLSALIVPMAAEANLVRGIDVREFITSHTDIFDFCLRTKVPRSSTLEWGGEKISNIARYYISIDGRPLEKVMPAAGPIGAYKRANSLTDEYYHKVLEEVGDAWDERIHTKNKSRYEERRIGINTGWSVQVCNRLVDKKIPDNLNYEWYIKEAEKLSNLLKED